MTKESKRLLYYMYKAYLDNRDRGFSRDDARCFGDFTSIRDSFAPESSVQDVGDCLRELRHYDYVLLDDGDDDADFCVLTYEGVDLMEQLPRDTIKSFADFITKFIP